jgi:hypothetical protein
VCSNAAAAAAVRASASASAILIDGALQFSHTTIHTSDAKQRRIRTPGRLTIWDHGHTGRRWMNGWMNG